MFRLGTTDVFQSLREWRIWLMLSWQDIRQKYRRSAIGPFWLTISMAVTIYTMGFLYSYLFKVKLDTYLPFLASGLICWSFISIVIIESTNAFIEAEGFIRNAESNLTTFVLRLVVRNFIIFAHNFIAFFPMYFVFSLNLSWAVLLLIPGIIVVAINGVMWGGMLAILGTRFRDLNQITTSLVQVIFFGTPIMWMPTSLPEKLKYLVILNPFYQIVNLIREPLLDRVYGMDCVYVVLAMTVIGLISYLALLNRTKYRVVFWL